MGVTAVNQLGTDGRQFQHEDCGLACCLSMALDAGCAKDATIAAMEQWYAQHGDSPVDGTGIAINVQWLQSRGLGAAAYTGGMAVVDNFLAFGYRCNVAIYSNSAGTPYSGPGCFGHFIEVVRNNGNGTYLVMQPVGGLLLNYTRQQIEDNGQNCGLVCTYDFSGVGTVTQVGGNMSGGIGVMTPQEIATAIKSSYLEAGLIRAALGKPTNLPNLMQQETRDPDGFQHQVDSVVKGQQDLHAATNGIISFLVNQP